MGYLVLVVRPHEQTADRSHRLVKCQKSHDSALQTGVKADTHLRDLEIHELIELPLSKDHYQSQPV